MAESTFMEPPASLLNSTVGALLLGTLFTAVMYGITLMQTYMYFSRFPNDPKLIKGTVWTLLALDSFHVSLTWHMIYWYLVSHFGDVANIDKTVWSLALTITITAVITFVAHCFYARRVYILGDRQWIITALILILALVRTAFGTLITVLSNIVTDFHKLTHVILPWSCVSLGAGSLADIVITLSLVFFLRKSKTGIQRTDGILDKLILWAVNTGLLTTIFSLIVFVLVVASPHNLIFLGVHGVLSKLYSNSLLATLNFRTAQHGRGAVDTATVTRSFAYPLSITRQTADDAGLASAGGSSVPRTATVVHVMTHTTVEDGSESIDKQGLGLTREHSSKSSAQPSFFDQ